MASLLFRISPCISMALHLQWHRSSLQLISIAAHCSLIAASSQLNAASRVLKKIREKFACRNVNVCFLMPKHTVQTIKCIRLEGNAQISALWGHERCCFHPQVWISHAYAPNLEQFVWSVTYGFMCKAHTSVMRTRTEQNGDMH